MNKKKDLQIILLTMGYAFISPFVIALLMQCIYPLFNADPYVTLGIAAVITLFAGGFALLRGSLHVLL